MARSVSWARRLAGARILSDDLAELARLFLEVPKPRRRRPARTKRVPAAQTEVARNG